jgi:arylsulfatase A-like enzyme
MYDDTALDPAQPTLPELLQRAGYATLGYHTGPYLAGEFGFARGFDVYENAMTLGPELDRLAREARAAGDAAALEDVFAAREVKSHADVSSPNVVARARAALERLPRERPLFLFAHLFDPHYDYVPPAPWDRAFDPGYAGAIDGRNWFSNRAVYDPSKRPPRVIGARDLEHVRALYRGEIGWTDAHVGELLDLVAERRRLEAAAVIVTADHGEEFFEHGNRGHRQSLWDEVLRVPLLVVPPGGRAAGAAPRSDALVQLADVLPTALELAGLDPLPGALGRSLAGAVRGEELADRPLVARLHLIDESGTLGGDGGAPFRYFLLDAWRTRGEKLVRVLSVGQGGALVPREVFWFDLAADPLERAPVVDRADQRLRRAWSAAELEFDRLRVAWQALPHAPGAQRATSAALLFVDDMAALGYAEGAGAESLPSQHLPWGLGPQPAIAVETLDE